MRKWYIGNPGDVGRATWLGEVIGVVKLLRLQNEPLGSLRDHVIEVEEVGFAIGAPWADCRSKA